MSIRNTLSASFFLFVFVLIVSSSHFAQALQIFRLGSLKDAVTKPENAYCLSGGNEDDPWAQGWKWMLERANGGDITIIRVSQTRRDYENWIYYDTGNHGFPKVNSVTTIYFEDPSDAQKSEAIDVLLKSEMIFFGGGDQSLYIDWFAHTDFSKVIRYAHQVNHVPMGGTSAGMAFLAQITFTGRYPSPDPNYELVSSKDVLNDPLGAFVDLEYSKNEIPFMEGVITDTHFSQRNRQGRLVGFMANAWNRGFVSDIRDVRGIAADESTAVCFDHSGIAKVYGAGSAFFLRANTEPENLVAGQPLSWNGGENAVSAYVIPGVHSRVAEEAGLGGAEQDVTGVSLLGADAEFNLAAWSGSGGRSESWWVQCDQSECPGLKRAPRRVE